MPPQIKQDLNRSGWETTDFPSTCENCLPENPYVQMLKEDHGAECKICTRPFTVFRWKPDRTARTKRTNICLTCARLKNCCQCCMLDLSFGLPIVVRDAALKMVRQGPESAVNREYFAQNNERAIEDGSLAGIEGYDKTDEKARELLRRLAKSEPYYKKQRRLEASGETADGGDASQSQSQQPSSRPPSYGPIRTQDTRRGDGTANSARSSGAGRRPFPSTAQLPPQPSDWLPPSDPNITSLFITGVEDDLPEHAIRAFFNPFGTIRSLVCSHRSHAAFINYTDRESAEKAAAQCQGKAVVQGCPLRVKWGKPKPLDSLDREERVSMAREGRETGRAIKEAEAQTRRVGGSAGMAAIEGIEGVGDDVQGEGRAFHVAAPPGRGEVQYPSLAGD